MRFLKTCSLLILLTGGLINLYCTSLLYYTIYIFECFIYLCNYELDQFQYGH